MAKEINKVTFKDLTLFLRIAAIGGMIVSIWMVFIIICIIIAFIGLIWL